MIRFICYALLLPPLVKNSGQIQAIIFIPLMLPDSSYEPFFYAVL
ncbi:hypothetical protein [Fictibacillus barbaricus]|nr:hypothetical protein [Fictibacillus barbaricus]